MKKKEAVIVLAGTRPHAELIKNLKKRGYRTVLIDYTENPVAKPYADRHSTESTLDMDAVERVAREENACRIMDICIDRPIPVAAYVAEKLHLPHPLSYESSLVVTNKNLMKRFLLDNGIPTSRFVPITDITQLNALDLTYPLIVKPSDASGSIGIVRVDEVDSLKDSVENALSKSRNGQAIVEEYVSGTEIQIDCFIENKKVIILDIKEKRMIRDDTFSLPYGSIIPARISSEVKIKIDFICNRLVEKLGLVNGPLYIQAIANEKEIYVIEFGVRFGGGLSFKVIQDVAGVDVIDATAESYLGGNPNIISRFSEFKGVYATYHIFPSAGVFSAVVGYEKLVDEGFFEYFAVNMKTGYECTGGLTSNDRVGAFILKADSEDELKLKLRKVIEAIDVIDIDGVSIMRKDIYHI